MIDFLRIIPGEFFNIRIMCGLDSYDAHMKDNRIVRCSGNGCEFCVGGSKSFSRTVFGVIDRRDGECKAWTVSPKLLTELRCLSDFDARDIRIIRSVDPSKQIIVIPLRKKRITKKEYGQTQDLWEKYDALIKKSINNKA